MNAKAPMAVPLTDFFPIILEFRIGAPRGVFLSLCVHQDLRKRVAPVGIEEKNELARGCRPERAGKSKFVLCPRSHDSGCVFDKADLGVEALIFIVLPTHSPVLSILSRPKVHPSHSFTLQANNMLISEALIHEAQGRHGAAAKARVGGLNGRGEDRGLLCSCDC